MRDASNVICLGERRSRCEECVIAGRCVAWDLEGRPQDAPPPPRIVHRGEHLFRAGERFETLLLVRSGTVKTTMISESGDERVIGFHVPGDLIGCDAIEAGVHQSSAIALDTGSVCIVPVDRLSRQCARSRAAFGRLMASISRNALRHEQLLVVLGRKSAEQRMASFLLDQSAHSLRLGYSGRQLNLAMPRSDIGSYLALAVETVSRVLTRFQEQGVLAVRRNQIDILDRAALERASGTPPAATPLNQATS